MKLIALFVAGISIGISIAINTLFNPPPVDNDAYPAPVLSTAVIGYPAPAPVLPTPTAYSMATPTSAPTMTAEPPPMCPPETPGCVP